MLPLIARDDLPSVTLRLEYGSSSVLLPNVLIDTGSGSTVFKADIVAEIGVVPEANDRLRNMWGIGGSEAVFRRAISRIEFGPVSLQNWTIDVARMNYGFDIGGIIGMDVLKELGVKIDLEKFVLSFPERSGS